MKSLSGPAGRPSASRRSLARQMLAGAAVSALLVFGLGGWAATTKLDGAVVASGQIVVEGNVKRVQHRDGGVVAEILVRDGTRVRAGDTILKLYDTVPKAELAIVEDQIVDLIAKRQRLKAEQAGATSMTMPVLPDAAMASLGGSLKTAFAAEETLFEARQTSLQGEKASLRQEITQIRSGIEGLEARQVATREQLSLIGQELVNNETLKAKGLVTFQQVSALMRARAELAGTIGQTDTDIAQSRASIEQRELKVLQLGHERRAEVENDLREVSARLAELAERRIAARDKLDRVAIRAPQDGVVDQLAVHTIGGVIPAGETIALIVPDHDKLVVEARIRPTDIDEVRAGQPARIRLSAFGDRTERDLVGSVTTVSADVIVDPKTQVAYYVARVLIGERDKGAAAQPLVPGMPAEIFLATGSHTALSYLLKPLSDQIARAMRES